ncbi:hypothetical protein MtrunA17_Chr3g0114721 [Medicago truncatula]|uniref:Uncharacterized protein n=1 Tax=Medicago truncatula TaxID=3880 RepID=A0A396IVW7_MEDTR|nr:hypothetical protein MtrunA17_Chr3g0114721 [Medicago truncatula]
MDGTRFGFDVASIHHLVSPPSMNTGSCPRLRRRSHLPLPLATLFIEAKNCGGGY